jgi:hypothetical protein
MDIRLFRWIQEEKMETTARANASSEMGEQYSLGRILGIWALAAIPMGIWVFPALLADAARGVCRSDSVLGRLDGKPSERHPVGESA